jgi:predicted deacetylase
MSGSLCIAVHDVAPATWPLCSRLLSMLDELGAPPLTLLIVPDYHDRGRIDRAREFIGAIERRVGRGDELALHGYDHLDRAPTPRTPRQWLRRRVLTASEGEFSALTCSDAHARIDRGLEIFERLGWHADGFVAPAWLTSPGTRAALRQFSFRYTTTHTALIDLRDQHHIPAPCLTASPRTAARRFASKLWLTAAASATARAPLIRVGLHPADAQHPDLLRHWRIMLARVLDARAPLTKNQAVDAMSSMVRRTQPNNAAALRRRDPLTAGQQWSTLPKPTD